MDRSDLSTGGVFAATGTYPFSDMQALVGSARAVTGTPVSDLLDHFGRAVGASFAAGYRAHFDEAGSLFELLSRVESHIHVEVRKLYPEAELPSLEVVHRDDDRMTLAYVSSRGLEEFARGIILAAAGHFGETVEVTMQPGGTARGNPCVLITVHRLHG